MAPQTFSTIPDDLLIKICTMVQEANPRSLHNLLFIKSAKAIAETLIYQRVTIRGPREGWPKVWPPYKILLDRLSNPQSHLSSLVRELAVVDWPGPVSRDFGVDELDKLVGNMKELTVFSWESWPPIPTTVLSKIHSMFPTARLHVKNRKRGRPPYGQYLKHMTLDIDLLRSTQLHSLELVVLQSAAHNCRPGQIVSEFPVLKQILQGSPNLRVLRLGWAQDMGYDFERLAQYYEIFNTNGEGPLNLQFQNKDRFPTLVEFGILKEAIDIRTYRIYEPCYNLSKAHCIAWKRAMNWRALVRLDLGNARPGDFFMIFCGHIPQLKSLKFRLTCGKDSDEDPAPLLRLTNRFLDSITGLEELEIADWTRAFFPGLWSSIAKHGHSLKCLEVNASQRENRFVPGWDEESLNELLSALPRLGTLSLAVDLLKAPVSSWGGTFDWPEKPFSCLCSYSTLESLQVRIRLPHTNRVKAKISHDDVSKLATDLFEGFFRQNAASRLELVDVQVQRSEDTFFEAGITGVTAKVKKSVRDDAKSPLDGGFEVEVGNGFDEF